MRIIERNVATIDCDDLLQRPRPCEVTGFSAKEEGRWVSNKVTRPGRRLYAAGDDN